LLSPANRRGVTFSINDRTSVRRHTYIKEGSVSGGPSFVAVVQSADLWQGPTLPICAGWTDRGSGESFPNE
jgi:hypothetical protein